MKTEPDRQTRLTKQPTLEKREAASSWGDGQEQQNDDSFCRPTSGNLSNGSMSSFRKPSLTLRLDRAPLWAAPCLRLLYPALLTLGHHHQVLGVFSQGCEPKGQAQDFPETSRGRTRQPESDRPSLECQRLRGLLPASWRTSRGCWPALRTGEVLLECPLVWGGEPGV